MSEPIRLPLTARFFQLTSVGMLALGCSGAGADTAGATQAAELLPGGSSAPSETPGTGPSDPGGALPELPEGTPTLPVEMQPDPIDPNAGTDTGNPNVDGAETPPEAAPTNAQPPGAGVASHCEATACQSEAEAVAQSKNSAESDANFAVRAARCVNSMCVALLQDGDRCVIDVQELDCSLSDDDLFAAALGTSTTP